MQNRIHELFNKKKEPILSVYFTAGYPAVEDTLTLLGYLEEAGVDMIEIGFPFSDPLADGPVIQQSSQQAIARSSGFIADAVALRRMLFATFSEDSPAD